MASEQKAIGSRMRSAWRSSRSYMPPARRRDNGKIPNPGNNDGRFGYHSCLRVPSKKRSKRVWKNFYILFPKADELIRLAQTYNPPFRKHEGTLPLIQIQLMENKQHRL